MEHGELSVLALILGLFTVKDSRYKDQCSFWTYLCLKLKNQEEEKRAKFKSVLQQLILVIVSRCEIDEMDFELLSSISEGDSQFDELFEERAALGKLMKKITKGFGFANTSEVLRAQLQETCEGMDFLNIPIKKFIRLEALLYAFSKAVESKFS